LTAKGQPGIRGNKAGGRFGRLLVLGRIPTTCKGTSKYVCMCDCGTRVIVLSGSLAGGHTKSCGCLQREAAVLARTTHGQTRGGKSPEYLSWLGMRHRCYYERDKRYEIYGGRDIKVCDRWLESFENFYADMGPRPSSKHSLDRIDNDGNYEPGNCRWATATEQVRNRSTSVSVMWDGRTQSLTEWAAETGLTYRILSDRLRRGWSVERAFTTPKVGEQSEGWLERAGKVY